MEAKFHSDSSSNDWGYKFTGANLFFEFNHFAPHTFSVKYLVESSSPVASFYAQLSHAMSSLPVAQWLQAGLHRKCVLADGSVVIDQELHSYLKFLTEFATPVICNVPIFFADSFKPLVLGLFDLMFSVNNVEFSAFIGDIVCLLLRGGAAAVEKSGSSVAKTFLLGPNAPRDQCTLQLLKQLGRWRRQATVSSAFQFSPSIQADYQSQHPYSQDNCDHTVTFPADVKHMDIVFDPRSRTCPDDVLTFCSAVQSDISCFSGTKWTKTQDSDGTTGCMIFGGNELKATFECCDDAFDQQQALWGYKFTVSGFAVAPSVRQSVQAVLSHLNSLFKDLLMLVCSLDEQVSFPLEMLDSDDFVAEVGLVLSEQLSDAKVRKALELIFFEEFSGSKVSGMFIKLFQRTIECAVLSVQTVSSVAACGRCNAGHLCEIINGIPLEPNYRSGSWLCDLCRKRMSSVQPNVWHCSTCQFDVCSSCQPALLERQNSEFHVGDKVQLVPPEVADYRSFSDAASGPMRLGVESSVVEVRDSSLNIEGRC